MYGADAVAIGTPIRLSTSWEGWCEFTALEQGLFGVHWGPGEGNKHTPCNAVDYDASIACDDNACTWKAVGEGQFEVMPTRAGLLRAHVTFQPRSGSRRKTIDLKPIAVEVPGSAAARCDLWGDGIAQVDIEVYARETVLASTASVRVKGGADCKRNEYAYADKRSEFSCAIDAKVAELEVFAPGGYTIATAATCSLVFAPPSLGILRPGTRYVFDLKDPYSSCTDDLMRETREGFAQWGWTETSTPAPGQTRFVASRNGANVEIELTEGKDSDERRICTWSMTTDATAIRGTHEIAD